MSLTDALKTLSEAHGPSALVSAFRALQGSVARARRASRQELGNLAQTFVEAMRIWDSQKADGVPLAERQAGLEQTLRASWPQVREWKFLCSRCGDTGWEPRVCTAESRCGRPFRLPEQRPDDGTGRGRCGDEHAYVVPCWCTKGQGFRRGLEKTPAPVDPETDYKKAGKFSRVGR